MLAFALTAQLVLAQAPLLQPFQEALAKVSFGPEATVGAIADRNGVAPTVAVGFQVAGFEIEKTPEPRCAEHHRREREQLGGKSGEPLDDFIARMQQECPSIAEKTTLSYAIGLETSLVLRGAPIEGSFRVFTDILPARLDNFSLQFSAALAIGQASFDSSGSRIGFRSGLEAAYYVRLVKGGTWHPVLQPFLRGEVTLLSRDFFGDQVTGGVRFLLDI